LKKSNYVWIISAVIIGNLIGFNFKDFSDNVQTFILSTMAIGSTLFAIVILKNQKSLQSILLGVFTILFSYSLLGFYIVSLYFLNYMFLTKYLWNVSKGSLIIILILSALSTLKHGNNEGKKLMKLATVLIFFGVLGLIYL